MTKTFTWVKNEAEQILGLERFDDRDNSTSYAMVDDRGRLDHCFRDELGFLKGLVSEQHKEEYKKWGIK